MALSFNQIPINLRTPGAYIEIDNSAALRGLPGMPSRILVIGQRLAAGTVAEAVPTRVLDEDEAEAFFGRGSMLHLMFRALKANNDWTETWAVALDDLVAGVTAAGTVSFGGAVTTAGTLNLYIAGARPVPGRPVHHRCRRRRRHQCCGSDRRHHRSAGHRRRQRRYRHPGRHHRPAQGRSRQRHRSARQSLSGRIHPGWFDRHLWRDGKRCRQPRPCRRHRGAG